MLMNIDAIVSHALISPCLLNRPLQSSSPATPAQNGTLIHFHEFKGFVEIRSAQT
jgi:hypothetical protein